MESVLSIPHSHAPLERDLDHLKFEKKIEEIVHRNPFLKALDVYIEATDALRNQINMNHIGELCKYEVFIHRRQKEHIPLLAKTIEEFEELINDPKYKQSYMFDKENKLFYHGNWRGPAGSNLVSI